MHIPYLSIPASFSPGIPR